MLEHERIKFPHVVPGMIWTDQGLSTDALLLSNGFHIILNADGLMLDTPETAPDALFMVFRSDTLPSEDGLRTGLQVVMYPRSTRTYDDHLLFARGRLAYDVSQRQIVHVLGLGLAKTPAPVSPEAVRAIYAEFLTRGGVDEVGGMMGQQGGGEEEQGRDGGDDIPEPRQPKSLHPKPVRPKRPPAGMESRGDGRVWTPENRIRSLLNPKPKPKPKPKDPPAGPTGAP